MVTVRSLINSTGIYFVGDVLAKITQFFLLPLFTTSLLPAEYGYFDISISFATCGISIVFCNVWFAMLRFMYENKNNKGSVIYNTALLFGGSTLFMLLVFGVLYFFNLKFLPYIALYAFSFALRNLLTFIARGYEQNKLFVVSGVLSTFLNVCLNYVMIKYLSMGVESLYLSSFISFTFQALYIGFRLKLFREIVDQKADRRLLKNLVVFSYPMAINAIVFYFLSGYTNFAVMEGLGLKDSGLVGMALRFSIIVQLVSSSLNLAWQELAFKRESEGNSKNLYSRGVSYYLPTMGLAMTIILPIASIAFPFFIKGEFIGAKMIVPLFMFSAVCSACSEFIGTILLSMKSTKIISFTTLCSAIVNILLCWLLIPRMGIMGAGISIVVAYLVSIAIRMIYLLRKGTISISIFPIMIFCGLAILAFFLFNQNILVISSYFAICFLALLINRKKIIDFVK